MVENVPGEAAPAPLGGSVEVSAGGGDLLAEGSLFGLNSKVEAEGTLDTDSVLEFIATSIAIAGLSFHTDTVEVGSVPREAGLADLEDDVEVGAGARDLLAELSIGSEVVALRAFDADPVFEFVAAGVGLGCDALPDRVERVAGETVLAHSHNLVELGAGGWDLLALPRRIEVVAD